MSKANEMQVGGNHYSGSLQHWDVMWRIGCGWEYYMAAASKYLSRCHRAEKDGEGGVLGLGKAIHYGVKLSELIIAGNVPPTFQTTTGRRLNIDAPEALYNQCVNVEDLTLRFCEANGITEPLQKLALYQLFTMRDVLQLTAALATMQQLHDQLTGKVAEVVPEPTGAERVQAAQAKAADATGAATPDYVDQGRDV